MHHPNGGLPHIPVRVEEGRIFDTYVVKPPNHLSEGAKALVMSDALWDHSRLGLIVAPLVSADVAAVPILDGIKAVAGITWLALQRPVRTMMEGVVSSPMSQRRGQLPRSLFQIMDDETARRGDEVGVLGVFDVGRLATPTDVTLSKADVPERWYPELTDPTHPLRPWVGRNGLSLDLAATAIVVFRSPQS